MITKSSEGSKSGSCDVFWVATVFRREESEAMFSPLRHGCLLRPDAALSICGQYFDRYRGSLKSHDNQNVKYHEPSSMGLVRQEGVGQGKEPDPRASTVILYRRPSQASTREWREVKMSKCKHDVMLVLLR